MRVLLLAYFVALASSEKSFEEKLKEGNQLLKNEPNAGDTMEFLAKLHTMEDEIKDEYTASTKPNADVLKAMKNYADIKKAHIRPMGDTIEEVNKKSRVDTALFQGDIILTKQQAEEIMEDINHKEGNRRKRQAYVDEKYPGTIWSNGVTFTFWNASAAARKVFKKAVSLWAWETCINFGESFAAKAESDRILVLESVGCWSHIGRIGGEQLLSLGPGCEATGIAVHEIGHALGLYHTQSRHDRDDFITLYANNIEPGWESQFVLQTEKTNYNYNITYDYGTIMHYGATGASANGEPFMIPRDIKFLPALGSHFLSFYEKLMVNLHYKCLDKCTKGSSAKCENGGYPHPRDCSKCSCPSGYSGKLCNERPYGCGKTLTATQSYQILNDTVGRWDYHPEGDNDDFYMCYYWIQGPAGSTIEVILDDYTENLGVDGCVLAGVEIKTLADKRHTGYRFCSPKYAGTTLVSTHNIVPVITWSRVYQANTILRYRIASSGPATAEPTPQPSSGRTPRPTRQPKKGCKDRFLCTMLQKFGFCDSSEYKQKFKEKVCPGFCA